jgi:type I restriction enzyme M protein
MRQNKFTSQLREQQAEAQRLEEAIWRNLEELGYGK